jgi:hypothetical protein
MTDVSETPALKNVNVHTLRPITAAPQIGEIMSSRSNECANYL